MEIERFVTQFAVDEYAEIGRGGRVFTRPIRIVVLRVLQVREHAAQMINLPRMLLANRGEIERNSPARMNPDSPQARSSQPLRNNGVRFSSPGVGVTFDPSAVFYSAPRPNRSPRVITLVLGQDDRSARRIHLHRVAVFVRHECAIQKWMPFGCMEDPIAFTRSGTQWTLPWSSIPLTGQWVNCRGKAQALAIPAANDVHQVQFIRI